MPTRNTSSSHKGPTPQSNNTHQTFLRWAKKMAVVPSSLSPKGSRAADTPQLSSSTAATAKGSSKRG